MSLSKKALEPKYRTLSLASWALIPEATWAQLQRNVLAKVSPDLIACFIAAVYDDLADQAKWIRPPHGLLPKHLCWMFLRWLVRAKGFGVYGHESRLSCGLAKSYVRKALDYVLQRTKSFTHDVLKLRPPEEITKEDSRIGTGKRSGCC